MNCKQSFFNYLYEVDSSSSVGLWTIRILLLLLFVILGTRSDLLRFGKRKSDLFFWTIFASVLWVFQQAFVENYSTCMPDGQQMLVQALKLLKEPWPWVSVDTTTSGPLNSILLAWPRIFGLGMSVVSTQMTALLLMSISTFFGWKIAGLYLNSKDSRLVILPFALQLILLRNPDHLSYTSCLLPETLITCALWLILRWYKTSKALDVIGGGFLVGLIFIAKIHAMLIATTLALFVLIRLFSKGQKKLAVQFLSASLVFPVFILSLTVSHGGFYDFWESYILTSLSNGKTVINAFLEPMLAPNLLGMLASGADVGAWFFGEIGVLILYIAIIFKNRRHLNFKRNEILFALVLLLISFWSVCIPGNYFPYYTYLFRPAILFCIVLGTTYMKRERLKYFSTFFVSLFIMLGSSAVIISTQHFSLDRDKVHNDMNFIPNLPWRLKSPTADALKKYVSSQDTEMSVWGLYPYLYVATGLLPATRDTITIWAASPNPHISYYRDRYLRDLIKSKPRIFVDAVGAEASSLNDRKLYGIETFPELHQYISDNYKLAEEVTINGMSEGLRIYLRR